MPGTEIYYFSGTGNSLHVARELAKRLSGSCLKPILGALKEEGFKTRGERVGIVFPIHAFTYPWTVKRFLEETDFGSASYMFAMATRECFNTVFSSMNRRLSRQNRSLDACLSFEMPVTYIPVFEVYSQDRIEKTDSAMKKHLDSFAEVVKNHGKYRPKISAGWFPLSHIVYPMGTFWYQRVRFPGMEKAFYADSECAGCGTCEKVCLSRRIQIVDGRPSWKHDAMCTYCFACIHFCPRQAIQLKGRRTIKKGRYHHPAVSAEEIAGQRQDMRTEGLKP